MQSENSTSATGATAPSGRGRAGDLRTRFLSALVLGPLVLLAVYFGGWIFQLLMLSFALLAAAEWVRLVEPERSLLIASLAITAVGAVLVADFVAGVEISLALAAVLTVALFAAAAIGSCAASPASRFRHPVHRLRQYRPALGARRRG